MKAISVLDWGRLSTLRLEVPSRVRARRAPRRDACDALTFGQLLERRYRVLELIGTGGMSRVYRGEHVLLGREVAIKVLSVRHGAEAELAARLMREARATAAIQSPHVVHVVDMGRLRSGAFYLVLEYLKGRDLNAMVAGDGPLSPARSVEVALQLCAALGCVHAAGIVHRDIKPQNVFLTDAPQACVKLLDFGICKVPEDIDQATPLAATRTGSLVGSPEYMAPEQIEGGRLDARTDIYGLGATLHFVLTGRPPFAASSLPRLLVQICEAPPPALPAHLQVFGGILARALAKRPEDRFLDATELRAALARV